MRTEQEIKISIEWLKELEKESAAQPVKDACFSQIKALEWVLEDKEETN